MKMQTQLPFPLYDRAEGPVEDHDPARRRARLRRQGRHGQGDLHPRRGRGGADLSSCGLYRYRLWREVPADIEEGPPYSVVFILLNPSTADAVVDDATLRRCIGYTLRWGFGRLDVVNLFALRATDPRELEEAADPIGPENDQSILGAVLGASHVVVGWGACPTKLRFERALVVADTLLRRGIALSSIGPTCSDGMPRHPLYLRNDLGRVPWSPPSSTR